MYTNIPHGGALVNRTNPDIDYTLHHQEVEIDSMALSDLDLLANGAYSPLKGFVGLNDYQHILNNMRLLNGLIWSIPITLPVTEKVCT